MKHIWKLFLCLCMLCLLIFSMVGCGNLGNSATQTSTRVVTDATGKKITIPAKPQRIVSLLISTDEILIDLIPPERIAALSYLADDPGLSNIMEKAKKVPKRVRTYSTEAIMNLRPDLVLMSDFWHADFIVQLNQAGIPVYRCRTPYSLDAVAETIKEVADVVGEKEAGAKMAADYLEKVAKIKSKAQQIPKEKRKRIYPMGSHGQLGSKGSLFDDMSKAINAENVVAEIVGNNNSMRVSWEQLVKARVDCIITAQWDAPGRKKLSRNRQKILDNPAYSTIPAIINKDVVEVSGKCLYCVNQYTANSLEMLAQAVYPEYFH